MRVGRQRRQEAAHREKGYRRAAGHGIAPKEQMEDPHSHHTTLEDTLDKAGQFLS